MLEYLIIGETLIIISVHGTSSKNAVTVYIVFASITYQKLMGIPFLWRKHEIQGLSLSSF